MLAAPAGARALAAAGFNVISCAGNHCLDWGAEALLETIDHLEAAGVAVIGAGLDIQAARRAHVASLADGTRVAPLAYCSILPAEYWATERRAAAGRYRRTVGCHD